MLVHPEFDPVAITIGPIDILGTTIGPRGIHWYGLMYVAAFTAAWLLGMYRASRPNSLLKRAEIEDLIFYGALGVVIGARIGYVFFYNFGQFLEDPIWLFRVWEGGMSFHGGMLGVMAFMVYYSRKINKNFFDVLDFVAPLAPLGLMFGRLGNFIGQELWGRETDAPWGMLFPKDPEGLVRHPSQLYQAALEGVALFVILFWFSRKPRARGAVSAVGFICYGSFRFFVEFFREPDSHIGFDLFEWLTRGQLLSLPMIGLGLIILYWTYVMNAPKDSGSESKVKGKGAQKSAKAS